MPSFLVMRSSLFAVVGGGRHSDSRSSCFSLVPDCPVVKCGNCRGGSPRFHVCFGPPLFGVPAKRVARINSNGLRSVEITHLASTHFTKIEGLETESEVNVQWTGSAAQGTIPKPQKGRYGAVGQSF